MIDVLMLVLLGLNLGLLLVSIRDRKTVGTISCAVGVTWGIGYFAGVIA